MTETQGRTSPDLQEPEKQLSFERELSELLNRYSKENDSDTPDYLLSEYLVKTLDALNAAIKARQVWNTRHLDAAALADELEREVINISWLDGRNPATRMLLAGKKIVARLREVGR